MRCIRSQYRINAFHHQKEKSMLELRPTCENCNKPLPPDSTEAMICTFECTFCKECAQSVLHNVCPNCGGGFCPRPNRPLIERKGGNSLSQYPAGTRVVYRPVDQSMHNAFASKLKDIPPEQR
jgi:uncharacterized protein